ncbi:uncharacterized protein LOC127873574 isoform X2 [Dreissena polymorpha]|uniref:uncharacterized protein LOC127873574 isoform X2 n=1 Tax=Dreissena polymorpha TaxID=45954 RepID=UPI002264C808|nr:uncharacterized protein LOC127873574 isoform X2 [Dreissena polymorpha]
MAADTFVQTTPIWVQKLRKCLHVGILPHYIIPGVNLFDGKLSTRQQLRLFKYVDAMIENNLQDLLHIEIDKFGQRLCARSVNGIGLVEKLSRLSLNKSISLQLEFKRRVILQNSLNEPDIKASLLAIHSFSKNREFKPTVCEAAKLVYAVRTSLRASTYLRSGMTCPNFILKYFQYCLSTDVASSHLKIASVLYCSGHLRSAALVLEDVEMRYHSNVKAVCGRRKTRDDLQVFANMISGNCEHVFSESPFASCVNFIRQEAYCAPRILWFEMFRGISEEDISRRNFMEKRWMDNAEVDARSFLYYLQYLTYGELGEHYKQLCTLLTFVLYVFDTPNINLYHPETALNLIGHCYEMEGNYDLASSCYALSLINQTHNNAAYWHVSRLMRLING